MYALLAMAMIVGEGPLEPESPIVTSSSSSSSSSSSLFSFGVRASEQGGGA